MAREPYEVGSSGYGGYRNRPAPQAASSEAAATTAFGLPGTGSQVGYVVGGPAPLDASPKAESWRDPAETKRRRILLIALAVAVVVAVAVFVVGQVVFDTNEPAQNPGDPIPTLPAGASAPSNP